MEPGRGEGDGEWVADGDLFAFQAVGGVGECEDGEGETG